MARASAFRKRALFFRVLVGHATAEALEKPYTVKEVYEKISKKVFGGDPKSEPDTRQIGIVPETELLAPHDLSSHFLSLRGQTPQLISNRGLTP